MYVNVYAVDRAYGGPEEGGWWYDVGEILESYGPLHEHAAYVLAERLKQDYPNTGASNNVLGGDDYRVWIEDEPGADYPTYRPFYE